MTPEEQACLKEFQVPDDILTKLKRLLDRMQAMFEELDRGPKQLAEPRRRRLMQERQVLGEQITSLTFAMIASSLGLTPEQFRLSEGKELARIQDRFQAIWNELVALEESGAGDVFDIGDMIDAAENGKAVMDITEDEIAQRLLQEFCELSTQRTELTREMVNRAVTKAQNKGTGEGGGKTDTAVVVALRFRQDSGTG
jgi:hypothetical protein